MKLLTVLIVLLALAGLTVAAAGFVVAALALTWMACGVAVALFVVIADSRGFLGRP